LVEALTRLLQPSLISVPLWLALPEGWSGPALPAHAAEQLA
jgi:hypothetical protein